MWSLLNALHSLSLSFAACRLQLFQFFHCQRVWSTLILYPGRASLVSDSFRLTKADQAVNSQSLLGCGNTCSSA